jgi:branched-chain amino acid aminotransferase
LAFRPHRRSLKQIRPETAAMNDHVSTHQAKKDARKGSSLIRVDGTLKPRASVSGFMPGDGVWEGIRLYTGKWSFLDEHLDRLSGAAGATDPDIARTKEDVAAAILETQHANGMMTAARSAR